MGLQIECDLMYLLMHTRLHDGFRYDFLVCLELRMEQPASRLREDAGQLERLKI